MKGKYKMSVENKPKYSSKDLIDKMKDDKGITFKSTSEDEALYFLKYYNNYMRTCSYRKNFQKYELGEKIGKYIELDFEHLKEMSILDMELRFLINKMSLDIEQCLKVKFVCFIEENSSEDGYKLVSNFLEKNKAILKRIQIHRASYTKELINKYFKFDEDGHINGYSDCPVWVLVEILTFGDFINLYQFYNLNNMSNNKDIYIERGILNLVKSLRNASAHNNCLLHNLNIDKNVRPPQKLSEIFSKIPNTTARKKKLKSRLILELSALIYVYSIVVDSHIKDDRIIEINNFFFVRLEKNKNIFKKNDLLWSSAVYIRDVVKYYLLT